MTSPAVYGPQKNVWRQRQHCDAAEAVFASLTEAANSGAGAYPPKTYEDKAKEVEQTVIDIQKKVSSTSSLMRQYLRSLG